MKTVQTEVPEALYNKAVALVSEGFIPKSAPSSSRQVGLRMSL
jgi:hypothetical protein